MKRKGAPKHQAQVRRGGGKSVHLGHVVAAKEAMLQQAREEGLTLRVAKNITGYFCVYLNKPGQPKPYTAQVSHGGKQVHLGSFVTAEEAALCVARSPEGQAAAKKAAATAAAAPPLTGDDDGGDDTGEESEEETVEVLDAVEVLVASDDGGDEEALAMEAEEVTLVVKRKRLS